MTRANFEPLRSLAFGSISGTYAAVGTPSENPIRLVCFSNDTEGNVVFSRDPTISAGEIFVAAGGFKLFDIQSNMRFVNEDKYLLDEGTQFYVKQLEAPVSGAVYIEVLY